MFSHLILDDFGEPLRGFNSKKEALWYIEGKPGLKIQATGYKPEKIPAVDPYQQALAECGPALL